MTYLKEKRLPAFLLALLLSLLLACRAALPVKAAVDYRQAAGIFLLEVEEESAAFPAVLFQADNTLFCFTLPVPVSDLGSSVQGSATLLAWNSLHEAEYYGFSDYFSVWTISDFSSESVPPLVATGTNNKTVCTLVSTISASEYEVIGGVTLGTVLDESASIVEISGVTNSDLNYPAALLNSSGNLVGIAASPNYAFVFMSDDYSGGNSQITTPDPTPAPEYTPDPAPSSESDDPLVDIVTGLGLGVLCATGFALLRRKKVKQAPNFPSQPQPDPISPPVSPSSDFGPFSPTPDIPPTESVASGSWCLVATGGYMMGRIYPMESPEITIGRSPTVAIPYKIESVSKLHCKLYRDNANRWMLMDCNSRNGTFLKRIGKLVPMQPVEVQPGDIFYLGSPQYSFEIRG